MNHTASRLPVELVASICDHLDNRSIRNLRLTCRILAHLAVLRLGRLFISASPRDIEVLCAVAGYDVLRNQVKEIIWVDTTMNDIWHPRRHTNGFGMLGSYASKSNEANLEERCILIPQWFYDAFFKHSSFFNERTEAHSRAHALDIKKLDPGLLINWSHSQELVEQQREALESGALICAFAENIGEKILTSCCLHTSHDSSHAGSFPALRRITVSATDGRLLNHMSETPAQRALPLHLSWPNSRGWPDALEREPKKWDDERTDSLAIRTIIRLLANNEDFGRVTALHIDTSDLCFGLNMAMLESDTYATFRHFEKVIARPGFKHLHLDLFTADDYYHRRRPGTILRRGLLKRALRNAANGKGLEYLHVRTNVFIVENYMHRGDCYAPLDSIFDPVSLSRIHHLSLSCMCVRESDLFELLLSLPHTLRSVELHQLHFVPGEGGIRTLMDRIRGAVDWSQRDPRPTLHVEVGFPVYGEQPLRFDLNDFLYAGAENPIRRPQIRSYMAYLRTFHQRIRT